MRTNAYKGGGGFTHEVRTQSKKLSAFCIHPRPVGTVGAGGLQPPQYFATICSIHFRENIARLYYKFAKIVTSSVTSYRFQSFIACSKNQCILDQERLNSMSEESEVLKTECYAKMLGGRQGLTFMFHQP